MPNSSHMMRNNATDLGFRHVVKNHHFPLHTTTTSTTTTIMMSWSTIKKRKTVVTPSSPSPYQRPRLLQFETPTSSSIPQRATSGGVKAETRTALLDHDDDHELFIFSPFGLSCRRIECQPRSQIQMDYRSIQIHLRKHKLDCKGETVRKILESYSSRVAAAKQIGLIGSRFFPVPE